MSTESVNEIGAIYIKKMENKKMPYKKVSSIQPALLAILLAVIFIYETGCEFDPSGIGVGLLPDEDTPFAEKTCAEEPQIFEDRGTLYVYHSYCCAESNQQGRENFLRVDGSLELPDYVTAATVFLNGWKLEYLGDDDHHVGYLATAIGRISFENQVLSWEAGGVLSDVDFKDGYGWCYHYTVVAWNGGEINALIDHNDENDVRNLGDSGHETAVQKMSGYIQNVDFAPGDPVAILPRGYGFAWNGEVDHHLLQLAYNLDHSDRFIEFGKKYMTRDRPTIPTDAHYIGDGFVSWETKGIYKDNSLKRDYSIAEIVSAIGGSDVGIVQPPYTILPEEDGGFTCVAGAGRGITTDEYIVENVPFEYAIPVLTGWEIYYHCDDEHVKQAGIWIDSFSYEKRPGMASGTLRYNISSILADKDGKPYHGYSSQVQILGLKPTAVAGSPATGPRDSGSGKRR